MSHVTYANSYIRSIHEKRWDKYIDRKEYKEPDIITGTNMRLELYW